MPSTVGTFGAVVSAEFIGALVQGLPELPGGVPALALFADVLNKGADAIPHGYGDAIGQRVYQLTRRTFREHDLVEEVRIPKALEQPFRRDLNVDSEST